MKTKECPSCAMDVDVKSRVCPICSYEFSRPIGITRWVAILLLLVILGYLFLQWLS